MRYRCDGPRQYPAHQSQVTGASALLSRRAAKESYSYQNDPYGEFKVRVRGVKEAIRVKTRRRKLPIKVRLRAPG